MLMKLEGKKNTRTVWLERYSDCFLNSSQIEELGSEGKVEEAQGMMKLVEQLKEERELLRSTTSVSSSPILV